MNPVLVCPVAVVAVVVVAAAAAAVALVVAYLSPTCPALETDSWDRKRNFDYWRAWTRWGQQDYSGPFAFVVDAVVAA